MYILVVLGFELRALHFAQNQPQIIILLPMSPT
jgi:hypothetical protein